MHFSIPCNASQRDLYPSPLSFQIIYLSVSLLCISVGQEMKAQGKWPLSQAAPWQGNAVSIWKSSCRKSLLLLKHADITHCQSVFRVHRTPLASDPESINDGIDFTRTNPVNEGCGTDPLVTASGNKEEFSGKTNYFNWVSCLQTSHLLFPPSHHDLESALTYGAFIKIAYQSSFPKKGRLITFSNILGKVLPCFTL